MPTTVLVACDPANDDRSPVTFARTVARALQAAVSEVTVQTTANLVGDEAEYRVEPARSWPEVRELHAASAAAGLQRVIADERPLLAVVGSARGAAYGRTRVGSTADRVLNCASRAVAVVPRGYRADALRSVAVGLLPSVEGLRALRWSAALARAAGVPLVVLAILRHSPDAADAAALAARLAPGGVVESRASAAATLHAAIDAAARQDDARLVVEPHVLVGEPADALLRASARVGLLVLGSRAYGPPGVVLPGGTTRRVLEHARSPVLLVPRGQ
jgi:nucleotide-binding universal stress UspA family protein